MAGQASGAGCVGRLTLQAMHATACDALSTEKEKHPNARFPVQSIWGQWGEKLLLHNVSAKGQIVKACTEEG